MEIRPLVSPDITSRPAAEPIGRAESSERQPSIIRATTAPAPVTSPVLRYDQAAGLAVLKFVDDETGEVTTQIPSERVVELYRQTGFRRATGREDLAEMAALLPTQEAVRLGAIPANISAGGPTPDGGPSRIAGAAATGPSNSGAAELVSASRLSSSGTAGSASAAPGASTPGRSGRVSVVV